jgi:hypothetical protein
VVQQHSATGADGFGYLVQRAAANPAFRERLYERVEQLAARSTSGGRYSLQQYASNFGRTFQRGEVAGVGQGDPLNIL